MKAKQLVLFICLVIAAFASPLYASSQQEALGQYQARLQKNPRDIALRADIIRHVLSLNPAPPMPEEFHAHMSRGTAMMNSAGNAGDFKAAASEFEKATLVAPWDATAYYNLGVTQDKAGMGYEAIKSLKLYLLSSPNAQNAESVEALINSITTRLEKR